MTLTSELNMTLTTEPDTKLEMKLCHLNEKGGRTRTRDPRDLTKRLPPDLAEGQKEPWPRAEKHLLHNLTIH